MAGDKMYFLIIPFGFLMAMRGARSAPLQEPGKGLRNIIREATDFFLTASLILALWEVAIAYGANHAIVREYALLGFGITAYFFSRYQKKTDVFFLSLLAGVFMISSQQSGFFLREVYLAGIVSAGIALFQAFAEMDSPQCSPECGGSI